MEQLVDKFVHNLERLQIVQSKDTQLCKYGIEIFLSSVIEIISILLLSLFVGNIIETLLFFLMFVPLRIYAGGYHANTRLRCYFVSLGMYALFTVTLLTLPVSWYTITNVSCSLFSCFMIYAVSPVIHRNKSVSLQEKSHYRKISLKICLTETIIILFTTVLFPNNIFSCSMAMGQIAVIIGMLVGKLNQIKK